MEGIEYSVDPSPSEDFWLIRKSYRADPQTTQLLSLYLVVGADGAALGDPQFPPRGTVFPMPDLHSVLKTNVATGLHYLTEAFDELNAHAQFHPAVHGYQWNFPPDEVKNGPLNIQPARSLRKHALDRTPPADLHCSLALFPSRVSLFLSRHRRRLVLRGGCGEHRGRRHRGQA